MRPCNRACVTLLSSTYQLSVTGSALASLGLAAADAGSLAAVVAAVVGAVVGGVVGAVVAAPPKPPLHADTASRVSRPSAPIRVADVAMVLLQAPAGDSGGPTPRQLDVARDPSGLVAD